MTDLFFNLLRVLISLAIVIVLILILLPYLVPLLQKWRWAKEDKDSSVKLKRIIPIGRNMFLIELEIKGRLFVVAINEKAVEVIYKDEVVSD